MSQANPFQPPQANVADLEPETNIDNLNVSDTWKQRFKWLKKAGGPSMQNVKTMSKEERKQASYFNALAFLFGPFYYLAKGMWKKAISLFVVCVLIVIVLELILQTMGFGELGKALGYGVGAVYAVRANIDYYKKLVLQDNGWW